MLRIAGPVPVRTPPGCSCLKNYERINIMDEYCIRTIGLRNFIKIKLNEWWHSLTENPYDLIDKAIKDSVLRMWK
jgi:hypothetical protein